MVYLILCTLNLIYSVQEKKYVHRIQIEESNLPLTKTLIITDGALILEGKNYTLYLPANLCSVVKLTKETADGK